jgi:perosamine synthetase
MRGLKKQHTGSKIMLKLAQPIIPPQTIHLLANILRSGQLCQGPEVLKFERALAKYLQTRHAITVSSGTAALHLSLLSLDIRPGEEVIVPAFSFVATANVVEIIKAKSVFVDIDLNNFCIDEDKIEKAITRKTKAIIVVHEFGKVADMPRIMKIAKKHRLAVIEDAACAIGAKLHTTKAGAWGDIGCFSMHPRKLLTTGEGGIIITNDRNLWERLISLRNHGQVLTKNGPDVFYPGLNYRLTELQAGIGQIQLRNLADEIKTRIHQAKRYHQKLSGEPRIIIPQLICDGSHIYQSYHILLQSQQIRNDLRKHLYRHGIEATHGATAIPYLHYYRQKYLPSNRNFLNSLKAQQCGLVLPIGRHLTLRDIDVICRKIRMFYTPTQR